MDILKIEKRLKESLNFKESEKNQISELEHKSIMEGNISSLIQMKSLLSQDSFDLKISDVFSKINNSSNLEISIDEEREFKDLLRNLNQMIFRFFKKYKKYYPNFNDFFGFKR